MVEDLAAYIRQEKMMFWRMRQCCASIEESHIMRELRSLEWQQSKWVPPSPQLQLKERAPEQLRQSASSWSVRQH